MEVLENGLDTREFLKCVTVILMYTNIARCMRRETGLYRLGGNL
jgi:hypothetical protein